MTHSYTLQKQIQSTGRIRYFLKVIVFFLSSSCHFHLIRKDRIGSVSDVTIILKTNLLIWMKASFEKSSTNLFTLNINGFTSPSMLHRVLYRSCKQLTGDSWKNVPPYICISHFFYANKNNNSNISCANTWTY